MRFKTIIIFVILTCLMTGICFSGGNVFSVTSDGALYDGACDAQGLGFFAGADGQSVIIYNGTGATQSEIYRMGGQTGRLDYNISFPYGVIFDKGAYADCSRSGTGTSNPRVWLYQK